MATLTACSAPATPGCGRGRERPRRYLDAGRVAEVGTHQELLARGGAYAELYTLQAAGYRDDARSPAPPRRRRRREGQ